MADSKTTKNKLLISDETSGRVLAEDPSISDEESRAAEAFFGGSKTTVPHWYALMSTAWTDAEHDEIMRLHIVDGRTIDHAQRIVFDNRSAENHE